MSSCKIRKSYVDELKKYESEYKRLNNPSNDDDDDIELDNEGNLKVTLEEAELESQNVIHQGEATFEKDEDFDLAEDGAESNYFNDATN